MRRSLVFGVGVGAMLGGLTGCGLDGPPLRYTPPDPIDQLQGEVIEGADSTAADAVGDGTAPAGAPDSTAQGGGWL